MALPDRHAETPTTLEPRWGVPVLDRRGWADPFVAITLGTAAGWLALIAWVIA